MSNTANDRGIDTLSLILLFTNVAGFTALAYLLGLFPSVGKDLASSVGKDLSSYAFALIFLCFSIDIAVARFAQHRIIRIERLVNGMRNELDERDKKSNTI